MGTILVEGKSDEFQIRILLREFGINQPTLTGCRGKKEAVRDFENLVKGTGDFSGIQAVLCGLRLRCGFCCLILSGDSVLESVYSVGSRRAG